MKLPSTPPQAVYPGIPQPLGVHDEISNCAGQSKISGGICVYPSYPRRDTLLFVQAHCGHTVLPPIGSTGFHACSCLVARYLSAGHTGYTGYIDITTTWSRYVLEVPQRVPRLYSRYPNPCCRVTIEGAPFFSVTPSNSTRRRSRSSSAACKVSFTRSRGRFRCGGTLSHTEARTHSSPRRAN